MNLEEIFAELQRLLATDAQLAPVPFLAQIADDVTAAAQVRDYNQRLEAALADPGVALVALVSEGEDLAPHAPVLDLQNAVMLAVVENPKRNTTTLTAFQYVRRILRVMKNARVALHGARAEFRLAKPAYNVGPLHSGTVVYFINLLVRSTEDLGPLTPA